MSRIDTKECCIMDINLRPILKWVGGKGKLLRDIHDRIGVLNDETTYYEPFVGGGAVLFSLQHTRVVVNDYNSELINLYIVIKNNVNELIQDLSKHVNTSEYFYYIRNLDRDKSVYDKLSNVEKASRMIYLNKTCFNGLYRLNNSGEFNSAYGYYDKPNILNLKTLISINMYFNNIDITFNVGDFENTLININKNSFVYFDPPYHPINQTSNFTSYTKMGFTENDQIRLKKCCDNLNNDGIPFLLSNSNTEFIKELYRDYTQTEVLAGRNINIRGNLRGKIKELLISNT